MNSKILLSLLLLFSQISFANPVQVPPPPMPKRRFGVDDAPKGIGPKGSSDHL